MIRTFFPPSLFILAGWWLLAPGFGKLRSPDAIQSDGILALYWLWWLSLGFYAIHCVDVWRDTRSPLKRRVAISMSASFICAPIAFGIRNYASEQGLLEAARATSSLEDLIWFRDVSERHRDETESSLLPRLELSHAEQKKTVEAIQSFLQKYPKSRFEEQARRSLALAYRNALRTAEETGTVAALRNFRTKYPESGLDREVDAAIRGRYKAAITAFQARAASPDVAAYFESLLQHLASATSSRVQVKFVRTDQFDGFHAEFTNAMRLLMSLRSKLAPTLNADVLDLVADDAEQSDAPLITITHHIRSSGLYTVQTIDSLSGFARPRSTRTISGVTVHFKFSMEVPGSFEDLSFSFTTKPPPEFNTERYTSSSDAELHSLMIGKAFDAAADEILSRLLTDGIAYVR